MILKHKKGIPILSETHKELIASCSHVCQTIGLPKSIGQIYGFLYLAEGPHSLDDMARILGISKASVSTGIRQLVSWGAIKQVWVQGGRRDYYEAIYDFGALIRRSYFDYIKPKLIASGRKLELLLTKLGQERKAGITAPEVASRCEERINKLLNIQRKIEMALPFAEKLL